ncbi:MAG: flagellar assembly peptidoglycan hydrolase FlgJ [Idiomarina sp.]|nr:flagellar assembly peptidoglycan hydrolase FlgJ [Idiomarina sp.]
MDRTLGQNMMEQARSHYVHDLQGLDNLRRAGLQNKDDHEALREAARHFESIFMGQLLQSMRSANAIFEEDNPLNSNYTNFYRDMHDQQLSMELAQTGSLGLADLIVQQLAPQTAENFTPASLLPQESLAHTMAQRAPRPPLQAEPAEEARPTRIHALMLRGQEQVWQPQSPVEFLERLAPYAQRAADEADISPMTMLAQAALETGWGQHVIPTADGESSNNIFNIKADRRWDGPTAAARTVEFDGTVAHTENARFRAYDSVDESFRDYVNFLQRNPRYQEALSVGRDAVRFAESLQEAGYATDPDYADKLKRIMNSDAMRAVRERFGF